MRNLLASTALAALTASIAAQTPPCFHDNDSTTSVSNAIYSWSGAGPNVNAWQVTPPTTITAESLRVYTGNGYSSVGSFMTLEIWDEAGSSAGIPNARVGGGTWEIVPTIGWQGANLDAPVTMNAGTPYWIVFTDPGWSTPPIEPGGITFPGARMSGGVWVTANATALKFRIFCGLLDVQSAAPFGLPCAASAGTTGTLFTNELPTNGNTSFRLEATGMPASALTFLVIGLAPNWPTFPIPGTNGCYQSTHDLMSTTGFTGIGDVRAPTALGHLSFPLALPSGVQGIYFSAQLGTLDIGATSALPFVTSNAMQVTIL